MHIIDSPDRGGTETLALDLCRNAKENNLDLILVVTNKGVLDKEFRSSGVEYHYYQRNLPVDPKLIMKLRNLIKKRGIEIVHTHQAVDGLHAYLAQKLISFKTVMTFHGHVPSKKDDKILNFLIPRNSANIAVSKSFLRRMKEEINFDTSRNFHVIYNGIDTEKFYRTEKKFRKELKLSDSDVLLGTVGNFYNDGRDQLTICKSLSHLLKKYSNLHFAFIGGRSDKYPHFFDECYNYCQRNNILARVHFMGLRTDVNDILNSLDIFVYSSNHDTFGIAVIEAMLAGIPTVINDLPPLLEVTLNGKYSKIFKSKDPFSLTERTSELISNKEETIKLGREAREWAVSQFSIENYISNLKNLYRNLLN
jgi:glycosyltransferase involved in cell wall biosynthesis